MTAAPDGLTLRQRQCKAFGALASAKAGNHNPLRPFDRSVYLAELAALFAEGAELAERMQRDPAAAADPNNLLDQQARGATIADVACCAGIAADVAAADAAAGGPPPRWCDAVAIGNVGRLHFSAEEYDDLLPEIYSCNPEVTQFMLDLAPSIHRLTFLLIAFENVQLGFVNTSRESSHDDE